MFRAVFYDENSKGETVLYDKKFDNYHAALVYLYENVYLENIQYVQEFEPGGTPINTIKKQAVIDDICMADFYAQ